MRTLTYLSMYVYLLHGSAVDKKHLTKQVIYGAGSLISAGLIVRPSI